MSSSGRIVGPGMVRAALALAEAYRECVQTAMPGSAVTLSDRLISYMAARHVDRETFPETHPIVRLRGKARPRVRDVLRVLRSRIEWLDRKIADRAAYGEPTGMNEVELSALAQVADMLGTEVLSNE